MTTTTTYLITGINTGLGYGYAKQLMGKPNVLLIGTCRSEEKCKQTRELFSGQVHESSNLECLALDLSDLSSIVKFSQGLKEAGKRINVLINNAGVYLTEFSESIDGLETLLQVNLYAPVLLTSLLFKEGLLKDDDGRIVMVSSQLSQNAVTEIPVATLDECAQARLHANHLYPLSKKLLNNYSAEWAKRNNVSIRVVCPGFIPSTDLIRNANALMRGFVSLVIRWMPFAKSLSYGLEQYSRAVTDADLGRNGWFLVKGEWTPLETNAHTEAAWIKCEQVLQQYLH